MPQHRPGAAAVVGAGVKTPAGLTMDELWACLLAGKVVGSTHPISGTPDGLQVLVAEVPEFDPLRYLSRHEVRRMDRLHLLAIAAADDALAGVVDRPAPERCAVVCGIGHGAASLIEQVHRSVAEKGTRRLSPFAVPMAMTSSVAAHLAMRHGFAGPSLTIATACSSGADAIGQGLELLRRGAADLVLAGGADSPLSMTTVLGFHRTGVLSRSAEPAAMCGPFDRDRDGFLLGEGAGFVVLRRATEASGNVLGHVIGYAATCDAFHLVAPREDGAAAAACISSALRDASVDPEQVSHVNAHGAGTLHSDLAEARALAMAFASGPPPVTAVKAATGHLIGGSSAVEAIVSLLTLRHGLLPPVAGLRKPDPEINLNLGSGTPRPVSGDYAVSSSFAFGGNNAVLVLAARDVVAD